MMFVILLLLLLFLGGGELWEGGVGANWRTGAVHLREEQTKHLFPLFPRQLRDVHVTLYTLPKKKRVEDFSSLVSQPVRLSMSLPSLSLLHIMVDTVCTGLQRSEGPNCRKSPLTTSSIQHVPLVQQLGITFILCSVCECVCGECVCMCVVKGEDL